VHDPVSSGLQFLQQLRDRPCGRRLDVVQQQHATVAFGVEPAHRLAYDLRRRDAAMPVIGNFVGAPNR
jgi:hypothetical protein